MSEAHPFELGLIEGWVDGYDRGTVRGWAWYPDEPDRTVAVQVFVDGVLSAEGIADLERGDLAAAGKRGGFCAFAILLPLLDVQDSSWICVRARDGNPLIHGEFKVDIADLLTALPVPFDPSCAIVGSVDQFGPENIVGWLSRLSDPSAQVEFAMWEAGSAVGTIVANSWRTDLEEARQGDGRWGFAAPVPHALRDGRVHLVELRLADSGAAMTALPLRLRFPAAPPAQSISSPEPAGEEIEPAFRTRPPRSDAPDDVMFSVIVNFYNMPREAGRTLTSLTRAYQQGIGDLRYEVLCVDNGSTPPLDRNWIESFGPEFHLVQPSRLLPSPCMAINEAARQAKGRYVAVMIDGAHILTPGIFREVWDAVDDTPEAVVAIRQWFVGGDQRWLSVSQYRCEHEDMLFDKIAWPSDGYRLFEIGTSMWEGPNYWLDGLIESNCLFMPRALYAQIGGIDEKFDEPGAGYANLDLFKRAATAATEPVIAILGEATFHQFHDGTTTNVSDAKKDLRVRTYQNKYMRLRGEPYSGVRAFDIRQRGQIRMQASVFGRQRPLSPIRMGVTDQVRQGTLSLHFDHGAADNLRSVYVECGLHKLTRWCGHDVMMAPADIVEIQDIVHSVRPDRIVALNVNSGVVALLASLLQIAGLTQSRIVEVSPSGETQIKNLPVPVDRIVGEPCADATLRSVERALGAEESILVLLAPQADDFVPAELLRTYSRFVTCRSYLIFIGTVFGQPWLGYSKHWYQSAIKSFVRDGQFAIDEGRNRQLVSVSPNGYLQRISVAVPAFDDEIDRSVGV